MTNNIIKQANNFLSRFSLNRYVMTSTFLNVYLCLIDKTEAIKNESEGEDK